MHYLIKQALEGTTEETQEKNVYEAFIPDPVYTSKVLERFDQHVSEYLTGLTPGSLSKANRENINEGDRLADHNRALYQAFDRYVDENPDEMDLLEEAYGDDISFDDFIQDLRECDVLLSNDTFETDNNIIELVQSYFESLI